MSLYLDVMKWFPTGGAAEHKVPPNIEFTTFLVFYYLGCSKLLF